MKKIGDSIYFARRTGTVVGHTVFKRKGHLEQPETYYIVELTPESAAYLEHEGYDSPDCFISLMLIHVDNEDEEYDPVDAHFAIQVGPGSNWNPDR